MRTTTLLLSALLSALPAHGLWKGFNVGANNPDGSCKSPQDWLDTFNTLKALPGSFPAVRQYATSDCDTLANSVPAALATGTKLLVGVWTQDDAHFGREKEALINAVNAHGRDWILAISVGSEDLYRKEAPAWQIAQKIYDVRGMVRAMGVDAQVGHVDTWTAWVDPANDDVLRAVDFVGVDGYPYFQGATQEQAPEVFWQSIRDTQASIDRVKPGTPLWITETGHPVTGNAFGPSIPSRENAQGYWKAVACQAFQRYDTFWYAYQDYSSSPSFGVVDGNRNAIFDLAC